MSPQDHHIFQPNLQDWPHQTVMVMNRWVVVNKPFIQYCLGLIQQQRKNKTTDIRKYINTTKKTNIPKATSKKKSKCSRKRTQESTKETQDIRKYGLITTRTTNSVKGTTSTTGRTEYYTSQGQPPDTNKKVSNRGPPRNLIKASLRTDSACTRGGEGQE
eukprot:11399971-Ditylum_brightwellii.AAC.1